MNVRPSTRPLSTALLVVFAAFAGSAAQATPADPAFATRAALASNTVTRAPTDATSRLVDLATSPAARRALAAAHPARAARHAATSPSLLAASPAAPVKTGLAIIEDPVGILMDLGGYTWLDGQDQTVRRAGVLAEISDATSTQTEATHVPAAAGQPHAVAPDLLFALLVEATRTQQNRIETLEAEALELRLALAEATEARDDQGRAIAAIQSRLGIQP